MKRSRSRRSRLEVVYQRRNGAIVGFQVKGHAAFAPAGHDIVCAAASALILAAAHGLRAHCEAEPQITDTPARYRLDLPVGGGPRAQAVLATMLSGLEAIAASYPGHVRIRQTETAATGPDARRAKSRSSRKRRGKAGEISA